MRIIVDTNIIFSALLKKNSKELELLLNAKCDFFIPKILFIELFKHKEKIMHISKLREDEVLELLYRILEKVEIIEINDIPLKYRKEAYDLVKNIDPADSIFISLFIFLNTKLWSGDKRLKNGLDNKNERMVINTQELIKMLGEKA